MKKRDNEDDYDYDDNRCIDCCSVEVIYIFFYGFILVMSLIYGIFFSILFISFFILSIPFKFYPISLLIEILASIINL